MPEIREIQEVSLATYRSAARKFYWVIPGYLLVPVGFWLVFRRLGVPMHWAAFGFGAAGWLFALMLFAVVNGIALLSIVQRTDEKAVEARKFLETTGGLKQSPLLGVVERIFATLFHIGSTLLIAVNFWFVIVMIPFHTALNLVAVRLAKRSAVRAEVFVGIVGLIVFLGGLSMFA